MTSNALSLLGLALRGNNLAVGEEPVKEACKARLAWLVISADDASDNSAGRAGRMAELGGVPWVRVPWDKEALGSALGRRLCAVAALTDRGLAAASPRSVRAATAHSLRPSALPRASLSQGTRTHGTPPSSAMRPARPALLSDASSADITSQARRALQASFTGSSPTARLFPRRARPSRDRALLVTAVTRLHLRLQRFPDLRSHLGGQGPLDGAALFRLGKASGVGAEVGPPARLLPPEVQ